MPKRWGEQRLYKQEHEPRRADHPGKKKEKTGGCVQLNRKEFDLRGFDPGDRCPRIYANAYLISSHPIHRNPKIISRRITLIGLWPLSLASWGGHWPKGETRDTILPKVQGKKRELTTEECSLGLWLFYIRKATLALESHSCPSQDVRRTGCQGPRYLLGLGQDALVGIARLQCR